MRSVFSFVFFLFGLVCFLLSGYLLWQRINPNKLSFQHVATNYSHSPSRHDLKPVRLIIPQREIDTPIYPAKINGLLWDMTDKGTSYLTSTPAPGEKGNSVLYGHNFANLLGKLPRSKPGDRVQVVMSDGSKREFKIQLTQEVTPDQTNILEQTDKTLLTVYTCSGFLDSKRFVAVATPI